MYKVRYFMVGSIASKIFETFHEATIFCIRRVKRGNVHEFYKVEE